MSTQSLLNYRVVRWATWSLLWLRNKVASCESWITYRSQAIKTVPGGLYNYPQLHVILSDGLLLWCILDLESAFLQGCCKENYNQYSYHNHLNQIIPIPFNITGLQHKKPVFRQFCKWNTYGSYSLYQGTDASASPDVRKLHSCVAKQGSCNYGERHELLTWNNVSGNDRHIKNDIKSISRSVVQTSTETQLSTRQAHNQIVSWNLE